MSYRVQKPEAEQVFDHIREYEYALIYMISEIKVCKASDLPPTDWTECQEARFFSRDKELHLYKEDGSWQAVEVTEEDTKDCIVKKYQLANRFNGVGSLLCVHEYLSYDKDGQAFVSLTRLAGIEGGAADGQ